MDKKNINLKIERVKLGKTQEEIAFEAGISSKYYSQLENNVESNPTLDVMKKIAEIYKCNIDYLFGS